MKFNKLNQSNKILEIFLKYQFNKTNNLINYENDYVSKNIFMCDVSDYNSIAFFFIKNTFVTKQDFIEIFFKNSSYDGQKIRLTTALNKVSKIFFKNFYKKSKFLDQKFTLYNIFYNFSKSNEFFFDLNFIFLNIINLNEAIFSTKVVKLNKRVKSKSKSKFDFELKYIRKNKRYSHVIKMLNFYSNSFNYYKYYERLLTGLMTTLFEQRNSDLYKKKLFTYNNVLKQKFGKK